MANEIATGTWFQLVDDKMERIRPFWIELLTGTKLAAIELGKALLENTKTGTPEEQKADYVVLALGVWLAPSEADRLKELGVQNVYSVGDNVILFGCYLNCRRVENTFNLNAITPMYTYANIWNT